jgi:hypothetical protein
MGQGRHGRVPFLSYRNDNSSGNIATGAYTQVSASLGADCTLVHMYNGSSVTIKLAYGNSSSPSDIFYAPPGFNDFVPVILNKLTYVGLEAIGSAANTGQTILNFFA